MLKFYLQQQQQSVTPLQMFVCKLYNTVKKCSGRTGNKEEHKQSNEKQMSSVVKKKTQMALYVNLFCMLTTRICMLTYFIHFRHK